MPLISTRTLWPQICEVIGLPPETPTFDFNLNMNAHQTVPEITVKFHVTHEISQKLIEILKSYEIREKEEE